MINFKCKKIINTVLYASLFFSTDILEAHKSFFDSESEMEDVSPIKKGSFTFSLEDFDRDKDPLVEVFDSPYHFFKKMMEKQRGKQVAHASTSKNVFDEMSTFVSKLGHRLLNEDNLSKGEKESAASASRKYSKKEDKSKDVTSILGRISKIFKSSKNEDKESDSEEGGAATILCRQMEQKSKEADRAEKIASKVLDGVWKAITKKFEN